MSKANFTLFDVDSKEVIFKNKSFHSVMIYAKKIMKKTPARLIDIKIEWLRIEGKNERRK